MLDVLDPGLQRVELALLETVLLAFRHVVDLLAQPSHGRVDRGLLISAEVGVVFEVSGHEVKAIENKIENNIELYRCNLNKNNTK